MDEKIESVAKETVYYVETENNCYTRHSAEYWTEQMGDSDESVYGLREEELEKKFQEFTKTNNKCKLAMDLKRIAELMMQYLKDSENESDFYSWADGKYINSDDLYESIVSEIG